MSELAVIVCGSRDWKDADAVTEELVRMGPSIVIHGACATGADRIAADVCGDESFYVLPMPAQWNKHGTRAGPLRNSAMLKVLLALRDCGWDVCVLAFPLPVGTGTQDMMRIAKAAGVNVINGAE